MKKIKETSLIIKITSDDLFSIVDLGCVLLAKFSKHMSKRYSIKGHLVINKSSMEILPIDDSEFIFNEIDSTNENSPQDNYFVLRFKESDNDFRIAVYDPNGIEIKFDFLQKHSQYYSLEGKNVICFKSKDRRKGIDSQFLFDPTTGKEIDFKSMLMQKHPNIEIMNIKIRCIGGMNKMGNRLKIVVYNSHLSDKKLIAEYTISDDLQLQNCMAIA